MISNSGQPESSTRLEPFWGVVFSIGLIEGLFLLLKVAQTLLSGRNDWLGLLLIILGIGVPGFFILRWVRSHPSSLPYKRQWDRYPARSILRSALFWSIFSFAAMFILGLSAFSEYDLPAGSYWTAVVTTALLGGLWATLIAVIAIRYERGLWKRTTAS